MSGDRPIVCSRRFLLFCRIGACLMIAPGLSDSQIPVQVRLFVALGATLALAPMLPQRGAARRALEAHRHDAADRLRAARPARVIGVLARLFFSALETLAFAAATMLGARQSVRRRGRPVQSLPPLATLITLGATTMIFVADLHWQIVIALVDSYRRLPFGSAFDARRSLAEIGGVLGQSFLIAARVASPFFLYSVIVNFAMALVNRVTPQIAIFFIAPPFVVAGGAGAALFHHPRPDRSSSSRVFGLARSG